MRLEMDHLCHHHHQQLRTVLFLRLHPDCTLYFISLSTTEQDPFSMFGRCIFRSARELIVVFNNISANGNILLEPSTDSPHANNCKMEALKTSDDQNHVFEVIRIFGERSYPWYSTQQVPSRHLAGTLSSSLERQRLTVRLLLLEEHPICQKPTPRAAQRVPFYPPGVVR